MISLSAFLTWLESTPLSHVIRESGWAFPNVEAVHVIAIALVVGSIAVVDLRLLGLASVGRSVSELCRDVLPCTWIAFVLAVVTGVLMFMSRGNDYIDNVPFLIKLLLIAAAGVNMLVFQLVTYRGISAWDRDVILPLPARLAGAISLTCWVAVVFFGRWIGFTMSPS